MIELFAVYALLLAGWGLWRARAAAGAAQEAVEESADPEPGSRPARRGGRPARERGAAARRHLGTLP
jgi:hypothetical protein